MMKGVFKLKAYCRPGVPEYMCDGMPELPVNGQFLPMWTGPAPNQGGGQANYLFIEGKDLDFVRQINPGPVQQWAFQPNNRSLYIIDPVTLRRMLAETKARIKRVQQEEDRGITLLEKKIKQFNKDRQKSTSRDHQRLMRELVRQTNADIRARKSKTRKIIFDLARLLDTRRSWEWCTSVRWPIIGIASKDEDNFNEVLIKRFIGDWAEVVGVPDGFAFADVNEKDTPYWLHTVYCGARGRRGVVDVTPKGRFLMPIFSPIGRRGKGQEGIFIRKKHLVIE